MSFHLETLHDNNPRWLNSIKKSVEKYTHILLNLKKKKNRI